MIPLKLTPQISPSHCGPAVLQALFDFHGYKFSQEEITKAAGADNKIDDYGTTYLDLQKAAQILTPDLKFFWQQDATPFQIEKLVNGQKLPVAVEWQGIFPENHPNSYADDGHYSIVSGLNGGFIHLLDPYQPQVNQLLTLSLDLFCQRWRETTEIPGDNPNTCGVLVDYHLLFYLQKKIP